MTVTNVNVRYAAHLPNSLHCVRVRLPATSQSSPFDVLVAYATVRPRGASIHWCTIGRPRRKFYAFAELRVKGIQRCYL
jgi:hypothetical protein